MVRSYHHVHIVQKILKLRNIMTHILIIGSGIGGLTTAAILAQQGCQVTVLEAQTYPGGCASTFTHQGFRFEAGATVAGGFQPGGPHALVAERLNLHWPVRPHDPAWIVHQSGSSTALTRSNADVLAAYPESAGFWRQQARIADLAWKMSAQGLPWPPRDAAEVAQLAAVALANFPRDAALIPFALMSVYDWMRQHRLTRDADFVRFIDGQLLISAQATSRSVNALYGATALDLARQGVMHIEGGIGGLAGTLVEKLEACGGSVLYRRRVTRIAVAQGRVSGVYARHGRHAKTETFYPADFVVANLTPWDVDALLGDDSPPRLRREAARRAPTWGAFVLHLGVRAEVFPPLFPDHHQILPEPGTPLGEGHSLYLSVSPAWDASRAPVGHRAVTISTHTDVGAWWALPDEASYAARKQDYTERMLAEVERILPGFRDALTLVLPGTPVTYQFYTSRQRGMVGGFPQTSLFAMRGPRTGLTNLRLVGDSIFPGQSTAGVTLGALRVAADVTRHLPTAHAAKQRVMQA